MKRTLLALTALSLIGGAASPTLAAACRDKNGKFVKCPVKPKVCRDRQGHYRKCK